MGTPLNIDGCFAHGLVGTSGHSVLLTSESGSVSVGRVEAPSARSSDPSSSSSPDSQQTARVSLDSWGEASTGPEEEKPVRVTCGLDAMTV